MTGGRRTVGELIRNAPEWLTGAGGSAFDEATAGKVTGDKELQAEGKFDKSKGAAHEAAGNVKDAFRNATKTP